MMLRREAGATLRRASFFCAPRSMPSEARPRTFAWLADMAPSTERRFADMAACLVLVAEWR